MMRNKIIIKILLISLLLFVVSVNADTIYYDIDALVNNNTGYEDVSYIEINTTDNLNQISKYINTKEILIKNVSVNDFSFINSLTKLEKISIYYSKINLKEFNNANIKEIRIINSYIQDDNLSYLKNAVNLEALSLDSSYIKDITSVKYLINIKKLSLSSISNLSSLTPILNLKNLKTFNINGEEDLITLDIFNYIKDNNIIGDSYSSSDYIYLQGWEYKNKLDEIIKNLNLEDLSITDKIKKITLFVVDNMSYDDDCVTSKECTNKDISFNSVAMSLSYKGICYHYALLEAKLLNKAGIDAYLVSGFTIKGLGHEWVEVYLDGTWYAIDPTWIDTYNKNELLRKNGTTSFYMVDLSDTTKATKYYKEHIPDVVPSKIVDVNGKYSEKEVITIISNDKMYEITSVILSIIAIVILFFMLRDIKNKFKKKKSNIKYVSSKYKKK